jgi:hypothetical protein
MLLIVEHTHNTLDVTPISILGHWTTFEKTFLLQGYRMLGAWEALVLVDESYEAHLVSLMDKLSTLPTLHVFGLLHSENQ